MNAENKRFDDPGGSEHVLLAEQVRMVLRRAGATGWSETEGDFWFAVTPPAYQPRTQGWKLHVSATPLSAPLVTVRVAEILVAAGCAFKVATGLPQLLDLTSVTCDRGSSGKVITAYPRDDEQFAELAEALHHATEHLPGPAILSDRPYRPGSLVHYRFGVFTANPVLSNDGSYESRLRGPDGDLVADRRLAWFSPPSWASCPLAVEPPPAASGPVLLAGRFEVREAIRHGNKGGVFVALDRTTGADVVIKQARPHVGGMLDGSDARDRLRHEAGLLERLAPRGVTPRPVGLFDQDGHLFLAQELVDGTPLASWVRAGAGATGVPLADAVAMVGKLVAAVESVHAEGLVLRDLTPTNVMVGPDGRVTLIDLEFVAEPGSPEPLIGTPGFAAPEQTRPARSGIGPAPEQAADLYALGAMLFFVTSGATPVLGADRPDPRPELRRMSRLVRMVAAGTPATRALGPAILGLLATDPARRWSLRRVRRFLGTVHEERQRSVALLPVPDRLSDAGQETLLTDGLSHLVETMQESPDGRPWADEHSGANHDPRNLQYGVAGPLAVLTRAAATGDDPRLRPAVRAAATWLHRNLDAGERLLPGLYFGCSGSVWALHDAALLLGDMALARRSRELAATIPVRWPNPDITHGAAGAGTAQLRFWQVTGDERFGARIRDCGEGLIRAATWHGGHVSWPIPAGFDSVLAGMTHYGFAHGVAGVGTFLLAAGLATGDGRFTELAEAAGTTLAAVARRDGDAAWWPTGEERNAAQESGMPHWCSGSSGIGTFLIRLWQHTGRDRDLELALAAAHAVRGARWRMGTAACHGLAGDGEFLLDLADVLGDPRYRGWAAELAACMDARAVRRDGRMLVPDESGTGVGVGYGTGLSGVLSFLLRLRHGGARPWTVDGPPAAATRVRGA
jgi:serine/threonine protein kinase